MERNYLKPYGELDIIARKDRILHFVEVKSVSRRTYLKNSDEYRAEDNVHPLKLKRIGRTIQAYIFENNIELEWVFDVITVTLDHNAKTASVKMLENIII
jgi:putative endonuclease